MTITEDVRMTIADDIICNLISGTITKIYKTPRAGATTSLILSLLKQNKKILVCEPTNKIIEETILQNISRHCKDRSPKIIHIPSNKKCIINEQSIKINEHLGKLPYMWLPNGCGEECQYYDECPVTQILREECDVIAITYDKLAALMLSATIFRNDIALKIMEKIAIDFILFDEAHELMYDKVSSLEITHKYDVTFLHGLLTKINKIRKIEQNPRQFKELVQLLLNYFSIIKSTEVNETESKLMQRLREENLPTINKHQATSIDNPYPNVAIRCAIKPRSKKEANSEYFDENRLFQGKITPLRIQQGSAVIYNKIIELTEYVGHDGLEIDDVIAFCHMLDIVVNNNITVHCQRRLKRETINDKRIDTWIDETEICVIDKNHILMLQSFIAKMQQNCGILFTSATFCEYDYSQLLPEGTPIIDVLFGENGDPLKTNFKMVIFADKYTFSATGKNSVYNRREEIKQFCEDVMNIFGQEDLLIICANKDDAKLIKKLFEGTAYNPEITYYRASEVMGVESSKRICITIGLAHKPGHGFDAIRDTAEASQTLQEESMHADVSQAVSRVKDPKGIEPSIVFALGSRDYDLKNAFTWGVGRSVKVSYVDGKKDRKNIEVALSGEGISQPEIKNTRNWTETLIQSILCKYSLYSKPRKVPYISDNNGTFEAYQYKINSKCSLRDAFFKSKDVNTSIRSIDGEFKAVENLTPELLCKHTDGKADIYFHALQPDNTINFAMFESMNERAIHRLKIFLDSKEIPYVMEKLVPPVKLGLNPALIRVWVLLENTPAENAYTFAKKLMMEMGFKVKGDDKEIEFYPKQTKRNSHSKGDLLQMPFGKNSQILVDGKFVSDFNEMDFGHLILLNPADTTSTSVNSVEGSCDDDTVSTGC
jgi:hypothetical protein